jgi:hypothetical protein
MVKLAELYRPYCVCILALSTVAEIMPLVASGRSPADVVDTLTVGVPLAPHCGPTQCS